MDALDFKSAVVRLNGDAGVCDSYRTMLSEARTRSGIMELAATAEGMFYMTGRLSHGLPLDYNSVARSVSSHINGRRMFTFGDGETYTSEIYIGYSGCLEGRTSALALWGCLATLKVGHHRYMQVLCDANTRLVMECGECSEVVCVYYGEKPSVKGTGNVKFIKKD